MPNKPGMMQSLFRGKACFSPAVPNIVQTAWVKFGGTLATDQTSDADYYFCNGRTDPWYPSLSEKVMVVFHAKWVSNAVTARFPVPIAPYVLNNESHGNTSEASSVSSRSASGSEERPRKKLRKTDTEEYQPSLSFDEGPSAITLVDEPSAEKVVETQNARIPFIDFSKVKPLGRKPCTRLRIFKIRQDGRLVTNGRLSAVLPSQSGGDPVPRLSARDARQALRHVKITKCALVNHNHQHLGKTMRYGVPPKRAS